MGKKCCCGKKKETGCSVEIKADFTKIIKRICLTVAVIVAIIYLPAIIKEYFCENDK